MGTRKQIHKQFLSWHKPLCISVPGGTNGTTSLFTAEYINDMERTMF